MKIIFDSFLFLVENDLIEQLILEVENGLLYLVC